MSNSNNTSSTQKLLNLIKDKDHIQHTEPANTEAAQQTPETNIYDTHFFTQENTLPKKSNIGIEIEGKVVRILAIKPDKKRKEILRLREYPLTTSIDSPTFSKDLMEILSSFLNNTSKYNLWACVPISQADIRQFNIPKVKKNEIPNTVFWSLKREISINEQENIFDFEIQGETLVDGVSKLSVMTVIVPKETVNTIKQRFMQAGYPLTGLTLPSLAMQNLFKNKILILENKITSVLNVADKGSRIDIFNAGTLQLSREIRTGIHSIIEDFQLDTDQAKQKLHSILDADANWEGQDSEREEEQSLDHIPSSIQRLVGQVDRTFSYYARTLGKDPVEKVLVVGDIAQNSSFIKYIQQNLGIKTEVLNGFNNQSLKIQSLEWPQTQHEQINYSTALGLALSENLSTLNLFYTYKEKNQERLVRRINHFIVATSAILAILMFGFSLIQQRHNISLEKNRQALQSELNGYKPMLSRQEILTLADQHNKRQKRLLQYSQRYTKVGILSELFAHTPSFIYLISVTVENENKNQKKEASDFFGQEKKIVIKGLIEGNRENFDSLLADFIARLESSLIFSELSIGKSNLKSFSQQDQEKAMHFVLYSKFKPKSKQGQN